MKCLEFLSHLSSLFWWIAGFGGFADEDAAKILPLEAIISSNGLRVWWLISMAELDSLKIKYFIKIILKNNKDKNVHTKKSSPINSVTEIGF